MQRHIYWWQFLRSTVLAYKIAFLGTDANRQLTVNFRCDHDIFGFFILFIRRDISFSWV
jgi:hypothetical protein